MKAQAHDLENTRAYESHCLHTHIPYRGASAGVSLHRYGYLVFPMFVRFFFQDMLITRHSPLHPENKNTDGVYPSVDAAYIIHMYEHHGNGAGVCVRASNKMYNTLLKETNITCTFTLLVIWYSGWHPFKQSQPIQEGTLLAGNEGLSSIENYNTM